MNREQVYQLIDGERDYQDRRWGPTESRGLHTPEEFIGYMLDYLEEARHIAAREPKITSWPKVMAILRKVTALGVACMEQHDTPPRQL